ncbi:NUDIX hydrolase [Spirosoma areae]
MYRQPLLQLLCDHTPADPTEAAMTLNIITFVEQHPTCFERSLRIGTSMPGTSTAPAYRPGHITGSAWIVSPDRQQTLLIHHRKLDRWLQPGGHADGDPDVAAVALREAQEETVLLSLRLISSTIFDVDIHRIPARNDVPEHLHYDIRFLLEADPLEPVGSSDEVRDIRWFSIKRLPDAVHSESIIRMVRKIS